MCFFQSVSSPFFFPPEKIQPPVAAEPLVTAPHGAVLEDWWRNPWELVFTMKIYLCKTHKWMGPGPLFTYGIVTYIYHFT